MNETLYSLDFESSVLGAILFNPLVLSDVAEIISKDDFYSRDNSQIFKAMSDLASKGEPIDDKFITKELGVGVAQNALNDALSSSGVIDVIKYARHLKELAAKRRLLAVAQSVPQIISEKPLNDALDELSAKLYAISGGEKNTSCKTALEAATSATAEILRRKTEGTGLLGISTGFGELDRYTNGLKKGDFVIIAARPGMGKTTFALNIVEKVLDNSIGAVFFSLEMPSEQLMFRMFSSLTSVEFGKILKGVSLSDEDIEAIQDACEKIGSYNFYIYDSGDVTVHKVRTELRKLKEKNPNIGLCVIDYIGLMANSSNFAERHLQIAEISRQLKLLARELEIPIIALSQLNRSLESRANKRPQLSDLRESGAIEQDADMILFVYRSDYYKEQEAKEQEAKGASVGKAVEAGFRAQSVEDAEIIIGKNRNGPTGTIKMRFDKNYSRFAGIEHESNNDAQVIELSDEN